MALCICNAYTLYILTLGPDRRFHGGTGVRRRRKSGLLERLPAARDRAVPPSGWRGVFTLVTRHGLGAPGFVEVPRARRRGQTRTRGMEVARRWRRVRAAFCAKSRPATKFGPASRGPLPTFPGRRKTIFSDALQSPHSRVKFGRGARRTLTHVRTGVPNFSLDGPQYSLANVREIAVGVALAERGVGISKVDANT